MPGKTAVRMRVQGNPGLRMRVLAKVIKGVAMRDGTKRVLRRGDEVYLDDVEPMDAIMISLTRGAADGSPALRKFYSYQSKQSRGPHGRFRHVEKPDWHQVIPAWQPID